MSVSMGVYMYIFRYLYLCVCMGREQGVGNQLLCSLLEWMVGTSPKMAVDSLSVARNVFQRPHVVDSSP